MFLVTLFHPFHFWCLLSQDLRPQTTTISPLTFTGVKSPFLILRLTFEVKLTPVVD